MAEPLKNHFGAEVPREIARMIRAKFPRFPASAFVKDALEGYEPLAPTPRGWQIARTLRKYLPEDYPKAVKMLTASLDPSHGYKPKSSGMAPRTADLVHSVCTRSRSSGCSCSAQP